MLLGDEIEDEVEVLVVIVLQVVVTSGFGTVLLYP